MRLIDADALDWGKPVGDGRPLADGEIIARLQDIKKQIGGSYAIERAIEVLKWLSSVQPETCEGCKHLGKWENEVEYGYPSPCTRCKRRVEDHYER